MDINFNIDVTVKHKRPKCKKRVAMIVWTFGPVQEQEFQGPSEVRAMNQLTETQQVTGTVQPVTRKGSPAQVQTGTSVFNTSDAAVVELVPDPSNELSVTVKAKAPGAAQVQWSADADMGDGVVTITAVADITVVPGQAVGGTIAFGPVTEQP